MKEDFNKFIELVKEDVSLQKELEEASRNYNGEQTEEAAFNSIIAPIAKEKGFSFTLDDIKAAAQELSIDEMSQVAGGETRGLGALACCGIGVGYGGGISAGCWFLGFGDGKMACVGAGEGHTRE